ncbi:signal-transducing histidine kinase [Haladaptatus paucihalophilus DX253]|uniref:histidine kinase n=2 Tax=Haladaptatus TaxID=367188 RepID=E7QN80_HALPU|nr:histidine kinase N-terminal 7TM domain-containing protein [Haladaptatus paucihalophilus]EFW93875.1 signal-transducing histidine kinase [Haladaptatus paucihalophilus DX253]SHK68141.1 PAS/PAC sensor signal transduction histidine kinase [Haladaptatus paucihalophilus DX253]
MQVTPSATLSVVSTLVILGVTAFIWRYRSRPGATPLVGFTTAAAVWTAGNALQIASTSLAGKLFWVNVQYFGIVAIPITWFVFACEYTGHDEWLTRRTFSILFLYAGGTLVLVWTNPVHHLVRTSSELVVTDGVVRLDRTFGPWFWTSVVYSNLVDGLGTLLLLRGLIRARRFFRGQATALIVGTMIPWTASALFYNGLLGIEPEVFFAATAIAFAYAIWHHRLFDLVPVGRSAVVDEMTDAVIVTDDSGRLVDTNPAANRLLDVSSDDIGRRFDDVCAAFPELVECFRARRVPETPIVSDVGGDLRYLDVHCSKVSDSGTKLSGTILIVRDVTEFERKKRAVERHNERLERVGHTIAHDLRNPLNVAEGYLGLERERSDGEYFDNVERAHDRMEEIIDDVLSMARHERSERFESLDLERLAERAWENVETDAATVSIETGPVVVRANEGQLSSVFENLFRNAVEHAGPTVAVEVGWKEDENEQRSGTIYVGDDGPGIPPTEQGRVFDHGYSTRTDGTGAGLSIVAGIAERHGWEVNATDNTRRGARFDISGVQTSSPGRELD